jgi:type III pantothenate kinase
MLLLLYPNSHPYAKDKRPALLLASLLYISYDTHMLLTLKVGNTTIGAGIFDGEKLVADWTISARRDYTPDELGMSLLNFLAAHKIKASQIEGFIVNSVVPPLNWAISKASHKYFNREAIFLDHRLGLFPLDVKEPGSVGADRIADCIAGFRLYGGPLLIIDFGTATTFNLVSRDGHFLGGAIAPTMELAAESLVKTTAQLFKVELIPPRTVIGKDTAENLQAGIVLGFLELVEGLIDRFEEEYPQGLRVISTGGRGSFFKEQIPAIEIHDEHLALKGLRIAWEERNREQKSL